MDKNLIEALELAGINFKDATSGDFSKTKIIRNPSVQYATKNRGVWFRPEYNFGDIQTAQDSDSYLAKSIEKKSLKFLLSGFEFSGENPRTVEYIKKRIRQLEISSGKPFKILLNQTAHDLFRYQNAIWVFSRDEENSGGKPYKKGGKNIKPISGVFIVPFETIEFKSKSNGDISGIRQIVPGDTKKPEWSSNDFVHFYINKRPGFAVASPTIFSAMEDILLLRRLEEQVEELIESNLFPLFHYKIGTDQFPERVNVKTGLREAEEIAQTLQYMPSSGLYISDWRHTVEAIGSEGKALNIDSYLEYFKKRVFAAIGVSPVDMGESDSSNRSTAQTQSKSLTESVEAVQTLLKTFIDNYFITPLLMESSFLFDPLSPDNIVEISFGKIDTSEQVLNENNANQLYQSNAITHEELRQKIGHRPLRPDQETSLQYHKFPDRVALARVQQIKAGSTGSTQAKNQHGTSPKKTASKRDSLLVNNLIDLYSTAMFSYDSKEKLENVKQEMKERLYCLIVDRIRIKDSSYVDNLDNMISLYSLATDKIESLFNNIESKVEIAKDSSIKLETIFLSCQNNVVELENSLESLSSIDINKENIHTLF